VVALAWNQQPFAQSSGIALEFPILPPMRDAQSATGCWTATPTTPPLAVLAARELSATTLSVTSYVPGPPVLAFNQKRRSRGFSFLSDRMNTT
jgi:hypothetical protein